MLTRRRDFYDAFVSIRRGLFNTRDRSEHSRKRKIISHTFAPKSVLEFEPYIQQNLQLFVNQWDKISETPHADGYGHLDCLTWCMSTSNPSEFVLSTLLMDLNS